MSIRGDLDSWPQYFYNPGYSYAYVLWVMWAIKLLNPKMTFSPNSTENMKLNADKYNATFICPST